MAVNPIFRSSPTRLMGLSSGMDTESIISATLRMHQFKIDNQMRNRQILEWKQKIHNDLKTQITDLRHTYLSNLGSKTLMNRNAFNTNKATATVAGGANATAVTISTSSASSLGSFKINQVVSLAKGSQISSSGTVSPGGTGFNPSSTLGSLDFGGSGITFGPEKAMLTSVGGSKVAVDEADITGSGVNWGSGISSVQFQNGDSSYSANITKRWDSVNNEYVYDVTTTFIEDITDPEGTPVVKEFTLGAAGGDVTFDDGTKFTLNPGSGDSFTYSAVTGDSEAIVTDASGGFSYKGTLTIGDDTFILNKDAAGNITDAGGNAIKYYGEATFSITDGKGVTTDITLKSNMSITEMVNAVNNSGADVRMAYDRMQDKFTIENKTIGNAAITITDVSGNAVEKMFGGSSAAGTGDPFTRTSSSGTRAEINIEGVGSIFSDTNTFSFRGVTIKVNEETTDAITVKVERNTDDAVNAIKDFIDSYNTLIKKLEDMMSERKKGKEVSYKPLTDEEKANMTEKQIEEWEAIAKKGIMRDDRGIESLISKLRASFFKEIEGTGYTASQLGLSTGNYFGNTGGQIVLDEKGEEKLRAALEEDPDRVADVFIRISSDDKGNPVGVGLLHKIDGLLRDYVNETQTTSLDGLERSLKEINDRIAKMEEKMWADEDKLYRQFAAMETALSKMQSQGDWFTAMLGG